MSKDYVRPATLHDALLVAKNIRLEDAMEVRASSGQTPEEALLYGFKASNPCFTIDVGGDILGVFGAVPTEEPDAGVVWMLGTDLIHKHWLKFLRHSRPWLDVLHQHYPLLFNVVDDRNKIHIAWLQWMGFSFINTHENYGPEGRRFHEFVRLQNV